MAVKITYFVHGTTTDNEKHLATGWAGGELSEKGIQQAKELGPLVKDKHFDVIFSSDLKRVEKRLANFLEFLKKNYQQEHIALVAHQAPQLALDVLLKGKTWPQAIAEDWRCTKAWQPGWEYTLE